MPEDRGPHGHTAQAIRPGRVTASSQAQRAERAGRADRKNSGITSGWVSVMNARIRVIRPATITPNAMSAKESRRSSPIAVRVRIGFPGAYASPARARMMIH